MAIRILVQHCPSDCGTVPVDPGDERYETAHTATGTVANCVQQFNLDHRKAAVAVLNCL